MADLAFLGLMVQLWESSGAQQTSRVLWYAGVLAAGAAMLLFLLVVIRALASRRQYRATAVLSDADKTELMNAVVEVERRTIGEIVPVILERSDRHPQAQWLAALVTLLLGSALFAAFLPWQHPVWLMGCQFGLGAVGFCCARSLPGFRRLFVAEDRATEMAEEQAIQEFLALGLNETKQRTGVLILVSLFEHRVVVLGDEGINERVDPKLWQRADEVILREIRKGELCAGLLAGIRLVGEVLAEHFPWQDGDRDELPNRIIVRSD